MVLSRLTKITGPGIKTDTNWIGNNALFTGVTTFTNFTSSVFDADIVNTKSLVGTGLSVVGVVTATRFEGPFTNLNVTGVATFAGDVSIGGTLTYEDVTNIDSVGIITAPGLDVDDFLDVGSNIKLGNAGVITATSFVGSGAALTGIDATAIKDSGGNVKIQAQASGAIHTGVSTFQDLDVDGHTNLDNVSIAGVTTMSGDLRIESALPSIYLTDSNSNPDYLISNNNGNVEIRDITNNGTRFQVLSSGTVRSFGNFIAAKDLDVDGHTNLDNVSIAGVTTFSVSPVVPNGGYYKGIINSGSQQKIVGGYISGTDTLRLGESMYLTSTGLGINESSPPQRLTVGGDIQIGFNTPNDAGRQLNFNVNRGSAGQTLANINWQWNSKYVAQIRGIAGSDTTNKDDAHLAFFTSAANNLVERLRIFSDGKFGFGTGNSLSENTMAEFTSSVGGGAIGANITVRNSSTNSVNNVAELRLKTAHGVARFYKYNTASTVIQSHTGGASNLVLKADGASSLQLHTNAAERVTITSDGDVAIGRQTAMANYAAGSTTTKLAVAKDAAGSGYHEIAHFTAGSDSNDTGAIVRITQFSNDRGLYIKGGRGTGDQAKALFGLRSSSASETDVMSFVGGGDIGLGTNNPNRSGYGSPVVSIGYNTSNNYSVLELQGNKTSDATIATIVGYNVGGSSRIAEISMGRDSDNNSGVISFLTYDGGSGNERTRIDHDGRLLHGNASNTGVAGHGVRIQSDAVGSGYNNAALALRGTGGDFYAITMLGDSGNAWGVLPIFSSGTDYLSFGYYDGPNSANSGALFRIEEGGNVIATGSIDSASDIKLKTNVKTIDNALDKVLKLRGAEYDRIDKDNKHEIGVIAQEVEKIIPELVNTSEDPDGGETKTVSYGNMVAVLIEAIKEQNEVINKMKKEIEDLKG